MGNIGNKKITKLNKNLLLLKTFLNPNQTLNILSCLTRICILMFILNRICLLM